MCALLTQDKVAIVAERVSGDERLLKEIFSKTCFSTHNQLLAAGIRFYGEAFFLQRAGARMVLRNDTIGEEIECAVFCQKTVALSDRKKISPKDGWNFLVEACEYFLAERLVANGAAPDIACLVKYVLSYFHFVLENGGLSEGWQYGLAFVWDIPFLPLLIPGDPRRQ